MGIGYVRISNAALFTQLVVCDDIDEKVEMIQQPVIAYRKQRIQRLS